MAMNDLITLEIRQRGQYQTTAHHLSELIAEYLPASVESLRKVIRAFAGDGCEGHADDDETLMSGVSIGESTSCDGSCVQTYRDLQTVVECLMVIAEFRGYATN